MHFVLLGHARLRDAQGNHVLNACSPNHFSELAGAHGGLLTRALLCEPRLALGRPRGAHAQEPFAEKAHAAVGAGASNRRWPRDDLRQVEARAGGSAFTSLLMGSIN